jgi:predicted amidophosphoribosyltransferase
MLEAVFPTRCAGCEMPGVLLCDACLDALPHIDASTACPRCAAPYGWLVCTECWDVDLGIDAAVAVGLLERPLSRCVTIYKDAHERRLAAVLGRLLAEEVLSRWRPKCAGNEDPRPSRVPPSRVADAIVHIPASVRAVRARGYDHALLLAQSVADHTGVPCVPLLAHVRSADQRALSREERLTNVAGAFEVVEAVSVTGPERFPDHAPAHGGPSPASRVPDRVLLIDDVLTTGATMSAAATALRAAGVREVRAGFLARAW